MQQRRSVTHESTGFASLDDHECLGLLEAECIGRLGFTSGALPVVVPIQYRLVGRSIIFATEAGPKLRSARQSAVACLEIDGTEPTTGTGWTVLATGRLREFSQRMGATTDEDLPLRAWGLPTAEHYVALEIELLGGTTSRISSVARPPLG